MQEIQITSVVSDQLAPLYEEYPNSLTPCPAYMALLRSGQVQFKVNIQGGYTFDVYYGRERTWDIPSELTADELKAFGEKLKVLLTQVLRGLRISWDEDAYEERGTLTPEAEEASDKIQTECDRLFDLVKRHELGVYMIEPSDYFDDESPEDYRLNAESSDDDIGKEASELLEHFNDNNMMMYGDLFQMIKEWVKNYK